MSDLDHRVGPASALRRRILARALEEAGDTILEVVVAALIVALIAGAVFTAFAAVARIQGAQRHQSDATELAQQDEQRLRGLTVQELVSAASGTCTSTIPLDGNGCYTQTIDGELYTITSSAKFYSASSGSLSCTTSAPLGNADYISTTSKVTWQSNSDNRQPVEEHSVITPSSGGQIVAAVQDSVAVPTTGVSGATVTITGPGTSTATQSATTDANGCALFVAVTAGSYSVSATIPSPYVAYGGTTTQSVIVVNNQTQTATFTVGQAATVNAGFTTTVSGLTSCSAFGYGGTPPTCNIPFDSFSLEATSESPVASYGTVGTNATPPSTVTTGATLYPYSSGYEAYAGTCTADDPDYSNPSAGEDDAVSVTDGGTASTTVPVPSMLLALSTQSPSSGTTTEYNQSNGSTLSYTSGTTTISYLQGSGSSNGWTYSGANFSSGSSPGDGSNAGDYDRDEAWSNVTGNEVTVTFTGTSVEWISSLYSNHGNANITLYNGTGTGGTVVQSGTYSDYAPTVDTEEQDAPYSSGPLTYGTYTLAIAVAGTAPSGATADYLQIDAFIVSTGTTTEYNQSNGSTLSYTSGTTTITYSSGWTYSGANFTSGSSPGDGSNAGDYDRDEAWSNGTGDNVTVTFTGSSIEWITSLVSNHGNANVTLYSGTGTGGTVVQSGTYSSYDPDSENQDAPYSSGPLTYGTYTLKVAVAGNAPSGASADYVTIDGFIVSAGSGSGTTAVTSWPSGWTIKTYDSCLPTAVSRTVPTNPVATTVSSQTVFPVPAPYGTSLQVCIANGTASNTGAIPSGTTQLSNTDFSGSTIQALTLPTTSGSGSSAVFDNSGSCP